MHTLYAGGWPLAWIVPYRALYFLLYAMGWYLLLGPYDALGRARLAYVFWVTTVREAVDRLLPVASLGGGVVGVRLVKWRGVPGVPVAATVIVEILLTLIVSYAFTAIGLLLLHERAIAGPFRQLSEAFLVTLPVPIVMLLLLRYGKMFGRAQRLLRPLVGAHAGSDAGASLDGELRACLARWPRLGAAGVLQFAALLTGSVEVWWALRVFGHPVGAGTALILESMTQTLRHVAFIVPAGIGVQEATLVLFGHALGLGVETALAVSMAKRLREVLCGLPALASWQWLEARRLIAA